MKNPLPVSKKAYTDFSSRIADTLVDRPELAREALTLLDTYLNTVSDASATADDAIAAASDIVRIVFTLIRPEIDRAVSRSARARSRRAKQRQQSDSNSPTPRNAAKPMERLSAISIPAFVKQRCPAESEAGVKSFINKVAVDFSEVLPEISDKPKPPRIIRRCIERAMRRLS